MKHENRSTLFSRNARFIWLALLFVPPGVALLTYNLTPHEAIWHDIVYSLLCLPIFAVFLVVLLGCVISFLVHRWLTRA